MKRPRIRPLEERKNLVRLADFAKVHPPLEGFGAWLDSWPDIYGARDLKQLVRCWQEAIRDGRLVGLALGAHVYKVGLAPLIIDLMRRGFVGHIATNGAGAIHDYEFALIGASSEDVSENLADGSFGFWKETFEGMATAVREAADANIGFGEALGQLIRGRDLEHGEVSMFAEAHRLGIPTTVHVAFGADIVHMDPDLDGAALGAATHTDFRVLCDSVQKLDKGLWVNVGSAVLLPEVFLKAVSIARNLGKLGSDFTTANLDMIQHYRAVTNVVERPPKKRGLIINGQHEIVIPLLHQALLAD